MTSPYVGEVRMFGGSFAPVNWALCNGQTLSISDNITLYNLIGTTYGGDGVTTFNLPNLQGRLAVGTGQGLGLSPYTIGQVGGNEQVTITTQTMPAHPHPFMATTNPVLTNQVQNNLTAQAPGGGAYVLYTSGSPVTGTMNPQSVTFTGGNQPHDNLMPSLCVTFIIALYGIFPSQS
jgi:microcystin-dependent protein